MNPEAKQVLELGVFFACVVIILDVLLQQIPTLDWFALGLAFSLVAAIIVGSMARSIPWQRQKVMPIPQPRNELQRLADRIDASVYAGDINSSRILSEQIKSIALGAIAVRTKLSKREILELAENHPEELWALVRDDEITKFLTDLQPLGGPLTEKDLEEMISEIEGWSL